MIFKTVLVTVAANVVALSVWAGKPNQPGNVPTDMSAKCYAHKKGVFIIQYDYTPHVEDVIRVKQSLKNLCGIQNLDALRIKSMRLLAVSRHGHGTAELSIGNKSIDWRTVPGNPKWYDNAHKIEAKKFPATDFYNTSGYSNGAWQVRFEGNVRVRRLTIALGPALF